LVVIYHLCIIKKAVEDKLLSPKFIYNLLAKFNGEKCCALCG